MPEVHGSTEEDNRQEAAVVGRSKSGYRLHSSAARRAAVPAFVILAGLLFRPL
ncbi:MAG TPA: hypothetical protein VJ984_16505 [Xanthomonadales bacterium]|nr:hypothetical protein [Xanthomonadales bacterium]